jgi:hypothetical protein
MDTKFQTSFIPKKPVVETPKRDVGSGGLFYVISVIIFVFSVVCTVGVFGYMKYVQANIDRMNEELSAARESLQPEVIKEISRVDTRFESAKDLLKTHVLLTAFFDLLESKTLEAVRFTNFSYLMDEGKKVSVTMKGEAKSYAAVALQSKILSEDKNFKNPQFSDLTINKDGNVIFLFKTNIDPTLLFYSTYTNTSAPAEPAQVTSTPVDTGEPVATSSTSQTTQ